MTMQPHVLRNLTMASAKHLVGQGHISKAHHAKIMMKVKAPAMAPNKPPGLPKMGGKMPPMAMSQAQLEAPVPMGALDAAPMGPEPKRGAGHYMSTMSNIAASGDEEG